MKSFALCHGGLSCEGTYAGDGPNRESHFSFYQAPAVYRGVAEKSWELTWRSDEDRIHDATIFDPTQDLLVIFEVDHDDQYARHSSSSLTKRH